jgi:hypothetical protein
LEIAALPPPPSEGIQLNNARSVKALKNTVKIKRLEREMCGETGKVGKV